MKKRTTLCALGALALLAAATGATDATGTARSSEAPLDVEAVLRAPTLAAYSPPDFSPDERLLAYVVTDNARRRASVDRPELLRTGVAWYGVASDIWITDLETGKHRNLTGGTGNNWAPSWSPDGKRLAFLSDRGSGVAIGPARLWVWERASDKLRQASDADVREGYAGIGWAVDNRSVFVSLFPEDLGREGYAALMEGKSSEAKAATGPDAVTAKVFEYDPSAKGATPMTDQVSLDHWRRDLGLIDVDTGKLRRVVTKSRIGHAVLAPNGKKVAWALLTRSEKPGAGQYLYDIVVHDFASGQTRVLARDVKLTLLANSFGWSPSSDRVAWRTGGPTADDELHVVSAGGGTPKRLSRNKADEELQFEVDPPVWDTAGRNLYFIREHQLWCAPVDGTASAKFGSAGEREIEIVAPRQQILFSAGGRSGVVFTRNPSTKKVGLARLDLQSGSVTPIFEEDKRYHGYGTESTISPSGKSVAYIAEDALEPADIFLATGDLAKPRKVTKVAPALSNRAFGRAEVLEWRSTDGEVQRGALVYPAGYEKGKTYPLIVKVYGGSEISNDLNRFGYAIAPIENLQLFATRGYALLLADSKLKVGSPMVDLMKSVMPGVNLIVEKGVADPKRIGVMGHSYGGYSTLALIVQSPRFKAAVMRAGMGDLISGYGQLAPDGTNYGLAWAEKGQGRMGGSPWEFRERYLENSPIFYLDRVQTPLLIIHGSKDDAVPVYLADEVFTGLRRLGKAVTYVRYEGESHWEGNWGYANQIDALEREIAWFDKQLKGSTSAAAGNATRSESARKEKK
jgi:dipeptidyl aminopeptidase/acylaminoacyl peptidase